MRSKADEEHARRMGRVFFVRYFLAFGVPPLLVLLFAFIATRR